MDWLGDVLERRSAEIADLEIKPLLHLPVSVFGKTNRPRLRDALEPRGDIDPISHQVAVGLLHDVPEMDANAELDAAFRRQASVTLDHAGLDFDGAADRVHHAAELDNAALPGALDDAAVVERDGWVDQVAAERPQARKRPLLV